MEDLLRPVFSVAPELPLIDFLRVSRKGHQHLALVRDAGGRIVGVVALQDVLENIVGDIREKAGA